MSRRGVRRRRLSLCLTGLALGAVWAGPVGRALAGGGTTPVSSHVYVVRGGDTLWSIASEVAPGADPRPIVEAIVKANDVDDPGALVPGESLLVPAGP